LLTAIIIKDANLCQLDRKKIKYYFVNKFLKGEKINYVSDWFINWLCYANAGLLNKGNIWCFDYAISHLQSEARIVEIGSFCGLSTNIITYLKLKPGGK
jgi:hypothetical protein